MLVFMPLASLVWSLHVGTERVRRWVGNGGSDALNPIFKALSNFADSYEHIDRTVYSYILVSGTFIT